MKRLLIVFALLLSIPATAQSTLIPCKTYVRNDASAPKFVKEYLARTNDSFVSSCGFDKEQEFSAATGATKEGYICRYLEYDLKFVRTGRPHLQRNTTESQTYMLVSKTVCPSPASFKYAGTYNLSKNDFEHIIGYWLTISASPQGLDKAFSQTLKTAPPSGRRQWSSSNIFHRLRKQIQLGMGKRLIVSLVGGVQDDGAQMHYEIRVQNPENVGLSYVVEISKRPGGEYVISRLSEAIV